MGQSLSWLFYLHALFKYFQLSFEGSTTILILPSKAFNYLLKDKKLNKWQVQTLNWRLTPKPMFFPLCKFPPLNPLVIHSQNTVHI